MWKRKQQKRKFSAEATAEAAMKNLEEVEARKKMVKAYYQGCGYD